MLKGTQIRAACHMLGWDAATLSVRAKVSMDLAFLAANTDELPGLTLEQAIRIQMALEAAGIRFGKRGGGGVFKPEP